MISLNDAGDMPMTPAVTTAAPKGVHAPAVTASLKAIIDLKVAPGESVTLGILQADSRLRDVFPDGLVPLVSVVPSAVVITTEEGTTSRPGYLVPQDEITEEQARVIVAVLAGERNADFDDVWACAWVMESLPVPRGAIALAIIKRGGGSKDRPEKTTEGHA